MGKRGALHEKLSFDFIQLLANFDEWDDCAGFEAVEFQGSRPSARSGCKVFRVTLRAISEALYRIETV